MLVLKGFVSHAGLSDNTPGVINVIGELSTQAATYTKEKGYYTSRTKAPNLGLVSFISELNGQQTELELNTVDTVLEICAFAYDLTIDNPTLGLDHSDFANPLLTEFSSKIDELKVGPVVSDGTFWMPEWISFKLRSEPSSVQLWFAEERFRFQFPESELVIAPPIEHLDNFFLEPSVVQDFIDEITVTDTAIKLQEARGSNPETFMRIDIFDYHSPYDSDHQIPVPWGVLIYGITGNNIDSIKDALIDFILSNSSRPRDDWAEIFPDIFKKNEFVLVPAWDKYAIPNLVTETGIYSPILSTGEVLDLVETYAADYTKTHIRNNATVTGFPFRSVALTSVGHVENRDSKFRLDQVFPDWINTNTNQDFNRMSQRTKDWSLKLSDAIYHAESFTEFDVIPDGLMKVLRGDLLYLTWTHERINYLVLCKSSVN